MTTEDEDGTSGRHMALFSSLYLSSPPLPLTPSLMIVVLTSKMSALGTFTQFPNCPTKDVKKIERLFQSLRNLVYGTCCNY
jgi:hypothetical protein